MTIKRPAFQFYPSDWRNDSGLRLCSLAARGLWVEMMCIAHECDEYGKLKQNGRVFCHKTLAKLVGLSPQTCLKLLKELEDNKVFSRDESGAIYSRRMVRDEKLRRIRAEAGSKGGNPNLLGNLVKQNGKQKPTPSSSSSIIDSLNGGSVWQEPSREQVIEAARNCGLNEDQADIWLNDHLARPIAPDGRWTDRNGRPVNNWQASLAAWAGRWRQNDRDRASKTSAPAKVNGQRKPASVWEIKQAIEAAEKEASRLKGDPANTEPLNDETPWERRLKPSVASRVKELKAEAQRLNGKLALLGKEAA